MPKNKISVALCTYNGAEFLSQQLESFLTQTRLPDELVVGDDGSNDETVKIIKEFAMRAPFPVRLYINEKNLGSTLNFERTIARCSGDIIFPADQDDIWLPEKIEVIETKFLKDSQIALVFSDAELIDENSKPLGQYLWDSTFPKEKREEIRRGRFLEVLLRQNVVTGATMAFRAELREAFLPIPLDIPNLIHDGWIALVIAARAKVAKTDAALIKYRQHPRQQLGLNLRHKQKLTREEKIENYAEAVKYLENEKARLLRMKEILSDFPQFALLRKKKSVPEFISKFVTEKEEQIKHYEARKNLRANRLQRFFPVLKEISSGRYQQFSKGFLSAAKDLFEK